MIELTTGYYYSYQDQASIADSASLLSVRPPPTPKPEGDAGPPMLAPDCSACGLRLEYMRYVCVSCGEGDMWSQSAPDNRLRLAARVPPPSIPSDSDGSDSTAWGPAPVPGAPGDSSACLLQPRSRTASMSTTSSSLSIAVTNGSASSPTAASPRLPDGADEIGFDERQYTRRGYELCPGCIETHGIVHAKAAAKGKSRDRHGRRVRGFRHTFREKIWGNGKWVDVEYAEDSECTICRTPLMHNRFKCECS